MVAVRDVKKSQKSFTLSVTGAVKKSVSSSVALLMTASSLLMAASGDAPSAGAPVNCLYLAPAAAPCTSSTGRRLKAQYQRICAAASGTADDDIAALTAKIDALAAQIAELKALRSVA